MMNRWALWNIFNKNEIYSIFRSSWDIEEVEIFIFFLTQIISENIFSSELIHWITPKMRKNLFLFYRDYYLLADPANLVLPYKLFLRKKNCLAVKFSNGCILTKRNINLYFWQEVENFHTLWVLYDCWLCGKKTWIIDNHIPVIYGKPFFFPIQFFRKYFLWKPCPDIIEINKKESYKVGQL